MFKLSNELIEKIKAHITGAALRPVPAGGISYSCSFSCSSSCIDGCAYSCSGSCDDSCSSRCTNNTDIW